MPRVRSLPFRLSECNPNTRARLRILENARPNRRFRLIKQGCDRSERLRINGIALSRISFTRPSIYSSRNAKLRPNSTRKKLSSSDAAKNVLIDGSLIQVPNFRCAAIRWPCWDALRSVWKSYNTALRTSLTIPLLLSRWNALRRKILQSVSNSVIRLPTACQNCRNAFCREFLRFLCWTAKIRTLVNLLVDRCLLMFQATLCFWHRVCFLLKT